MWDDPEGLSRKINALDARLKVVEEKLSKIGGAEHPTLSDDISAVVHDLADGMAALRTHRPALFEPRKEPEENPTS